MRLSLVALGCVALVFVICFVATYPPRQITVGFSEPDIETCEFQSVSGNATSATITIHAQSARYSPSYEPKGPIVLDSAIIKDSLGEVIEVVDATSIDDHDANTEADVPRVDAEFSRLDIAVTPEKLIAGEYYILTLVSNIGSSFVSPSFKPVV